MWNPGEPEPGTIREVLSRQKDVQYSSRAVSHIRRQKQIHHLRRIIPNSRCACRKASAKPISCAKWQVMGALAACMSSASSPHHAEATTIPSISTSAAKASAAGGQPDMEARAMCSLTPVGSRGRSERGLLLARMPPGDRSNGVMPSRVWPVPAIAIRPRGTSSAKLEARAGLQRIKPSLQRTRSAAAS
jgi:hypothetical protein